MSTKMNAKQRAVQKVKERLRNKLDNLLFQKKTLYSMVDSLVSEVRLKWFSGKICLVNFFVSEVRSI
ncbi:hypothetical protein DPMN_121801 [Dreissena polymorpha]|uniref:Uncharacterized protein n=1 Tax=Dreissena polymorpha TaxID=45954 RepID=A0A9D4JTW3_DREPO|nr:hypothetical protein DPMN_121801 [Dreissena polymorpha]